ncbi:MAG: hypothetical protein GY953_29530 [bacterium]|nr:hypothetical protein [bacterium]
MTILRSGLFLAGMLMVLATHAIGAEGTNSVTVLVYNYAKVPVETIEEARGVTTWILQRAGLGVDWAEPGSGVRLFRRSDLVLRLVSEAKISCWGLDASHLAFSLVPSKSRSSFIAGVVFDRVEKVASREGYPLAMVLGHVMAHELGHLLSGARQHSLAGIMSFPVSRRYLVQASKGQLRFTPSQQRRIRREVRRRSED